MRNYYHILNVPVSASKPRVFRAFKKAFLKARSAEQKVQLLSGFLLMVQEHQKFLDILLAQQKRGKPLTPKYQKVLRYHEKKAQYVVYDAHKEAALQKVLKRYPYRESASGLFCLFLYGADRHYFELSYLLIFIGLIFLFQENAQPAIGYVGCSLIAAGLYAHVRIVWNVKIEKIKDLAGEGD